MTNNVVLYTTSCATTTKQKKDYSKLKHILDVNKYNYEEVDLATAPHRRLEMLAASNDLIQLPQLHAQGHLIGTAEDVQELEDWGELKAILLETKTITPKKDIQQSLHPAVVLGAVDNRNQQQEEHEQQYIQSQPLADPVFTLTEEEEE